MSSGRGALRAVLVPAFAAIALAAALAFLLSPGREQHPPTPRPSAAPQSHTIALDEPLLPEPPLAAEPVAPTLVPVAPSRMPDAPAKAPSPLPENPEPMTPELRKRALTMFIPAIKQAMETGNLEHLRRVKRVLAQRRSEHLLSRDDEEALDLAIDCLEHVPEARDEARDLVQFSGSSFGDSLLRACD